MATSIIATLAAGSSNSPFYLMANITKKLCKPACVSNPPVFSPTFKVLGWSQVAAGQYMAQVQAQGIVIYDPCGTKCCAKSEPVSQTFSIPFASANAPTSVTISQGATINDISVNGCATCGTTFVSETPITLTIA